MKRLIAKIYRKILYNQFKKKISLIGSGQRFGRSSRVVFYDGSKRNQIVLKSHVDMYGALMVSNNGIIIMEDFSKIGYHSKIQAVNKVTIGKYTAIADGVTITDNNTHPISPAYRKEMRLTPHGSDMRQWKHAENKPINIGENVWIGSNVRICKGVNIGDNSIIAANSVVTKDVPPNAVAAGNPAKIVKTDIDLC